MSPLNFSLIPLTGTDAEFVYELYTHPKIEQAYRVPPIGARGKVEAFIRRITSGGDQAWKIRLDGSGGVDVGICGLHNMVDVYRTAEVGGTLHPEWWSRGIMEAAFRRMIDESRQASELGRLIGKTTPENLRAIRLVEKLGFRKVAQNAEEVVLALDL